MKYSAGLKSNSASSIEKLAGRRQAGTLQRKWHYKRLPAPSSTRPETRSAVFGTERRGSSSEAGGGSGGGDIRDELQLTKYDSHRPAVPPPKRFSGSPMKLREQDGRSTVSKIEMISIKKRSRER